MTSQQTNQVVRRSNLIRRYRGRLDAYEELLIRAHMLLSEIVEADRYRDSMATARALLRDIEAKII